MNKIFICIGQCGCQIGSHLVKYVVEEANQILKLNAGSLKFIFVDTDTKVIQALRCLSFMRSLVSEDMFINGKHGCGGNWYAGYISHDVIDKCLSVIRRYAKESDNVDGMFVPNYFGPQVIALVRPCVRPSLCLSLNISETVH